MCVLFDSFGFSYLILLAMDTLRVYRPRVVLHGPSGMGQAYVGAAALHHLEGFHVQSLDLANLMGDSSRVSKFRSSNNEC
jgi:ATPase family AAA domain-containing protein 2